MWPNLCCATVRNDGKFRTDQRIFDREARSELHLLQLWANRNAPALSLNWPSTGLPVYWPISAIEKPDFACARNDSVGFEGQRSPNCLLRLRFRPLHRHLLDPKANRRLIHVPLSSRRRPLFAWNLRLVCAQVLRDPGWPEPKPTEIFLVLRTSDEQGIWPVQFQWDPTFQDHSFWHQPRSNYLPKDHFIFQHLNKSSVRPN